jgi:hypothetical protein
MQSVTPAEYFLQQNPITTVYKGGGGGGPLYTVYNVYMYTVHIYNISTYSVIHTGKGGGGS